MGMDLYGRKPLNEKGEYFRNNVWYWRPLANFIIDHYPDIAKKCKSWQTNDGFGLGITDTKKLIAALEKDLELGLIKIHEDKFNEVRSEIPLEVCDICKGSGIRTDKLGEELGFSNKKLDKAEAVKFGREKGWCNGCNGRGKTEKCESFYQFTTENVEEFVEFLRYSGSFKIY